MDKGHFLAERESTSRYSRLHSGANFARESESRNRTRIFDSETTNDGFRTSGISPDHDTPPPECIFDQILSSRSYTASNWPRYLDSLSRTFLVEKDNGFHFLASDTTFHTARCFLLSFLEFKISTLCQSSEHVVGGHVELQRSFQVLPSG